ncbi:MAG TPA: hypothetical protein DDW50_18760, partial [Firmicutes bacterium]|nr:hypothetical protein [Bacillota bacterium]
GGFHGAQGKQAVKGRSVLKAFWVTVSNPKSFLFFVAFMPQFINKKEFFLPQLLILGGTYLSLGLLNDMTYTILADKAGLFLNRYSPQKIIYRIGALNMIVTGILVFARIAK